MGGEVNYVSVLLRANTAAAELLRGTAAAGTVVGGGVAQQTHAYDHIARKDTETEKHNLLPSAPPVKRSRCDIPFPAPLPCEGSGGAVASSTHHSCEPSLLQTSPSKPTLGAQASVPLLLSSGQGGAGAKRSQAKCLNSDLKAPQPAVSQPQSSGAKLGTSGQQMGGAGTFASVLKPMGTAAAGTAVGVPGGVAHQARDVEQEHSKADEEPEEIPGFDEGQDQRQESMINNEDDPNEEDMECSFHVPDGFRISQEPPDENALGMERDNSQADALVDRFIMYKWLGLGWCTGKILRRNTDARRKVNKQPVNFYVHYEVDKTEAAHALSLDKYRREGTGEAPYDQWVLLEKVPA